MISYISGSVVFSDEQRVFIATACGVGYALSVAHPVRGEVEYFVYTHLTETAVEYFGFETVDMLDKFKALLRVKGVGVRTAFQVICDLGDPGCADVQALLRVKGVGRKTAGLIVKQMAQFC